MSRNYKIAIVVVALAVIFVGLVLPAFAWVSNCGGNSAALSVCKFCCLNLRLASDTQGGRFDIHSLSSSEKSDLIKSSHSAWIPDARIFVRTNIVFAAVPKEILVVCAEPYDNIPRATFWNGYKHSSAYAVGYSDGSSGLISPMNFKELNLSEFINVAALNTNAPLMTKGGLP